MFYSLRICYDVVKGRQDLIGVMDCLCVCVCLRLAVIVFNPETLF